MTRDTNVEWSGISSLQDRLERVFFGVGGTEFEVKEAFKSGANSGVVPEPGRTYTMVAKLDFDAGSIALWLDPDFSKEESANQPTAAMPYPHSYSSTGVRLGSGGNGFTTWDNLVVADHWRGLTLVPATTGR